MDRTFVDTSSTQTLYGKTLVNPTINGAVTVDSSAVLNSLLPSQTSNSGKVLQTDGSNTSWQTLTVNTPVNGLVLINSVSLGITSPRSVVEDATYYYVGGNSNPAKIARVLKSTFEVDATLTLTGVGLAQLIIDTANDRIYASVYGATPGKIIRVAISTFLEVASPLTLPSGHDYAGGMAIDIPNQKLYVGSLYHLTTTGPDYVDKIDIGTWVVTDTITGALAGVGGATANERGFYILIPDFVNNILYVGEDTVAAQIMKINLTNFTRVTTLSISNGGRAGIGSGALILDEPNGWLYNLSNNIGDPLLVEKISTSSFTLISSLALSSNNQSGTLFATQLDPTDQKLYIFGGYKDYALVVRVPDLTPLQYLVPTSPLTHSSNFLVGSLIDTSARLILAPDYELGYLYKWAY